MNHIGDATISVVHVNNFGVSAKYYNSFSISGTPDYMNSLQDLDFYYLGDITPGVTD